MRVPEPTTTSRHLGNNIYLTCEYLKTKRTQCVLTPLSLSIFFSFADGFPY